MQKFINFNISLLPGIFLFFIEFNFSVASFRQTEHNQPLSMLRTSDMLCDTRLNDFVAQLAFR